MKKIIVIGDIISSRAIASRNSAQSKLLKALKTINENEKSIISPFTITLGDEFQVVYKNAAGLFINMFAIFAEIYPIKVRVSIGVGEITTKLNRKQAIGMDGPAFYMARSGMEEIKKTGAILNFNSEPFCESELLRSSLFLVSNVVSKWTLNKFHILKMLMEKKTILEMSKQLGITDKGVYKHIENGGIKYVLEVLNTMSKIIEREIKGS